jgi:hypothetical protein
MGKLEIVIIHSMVQPNLSSVVILGYITFLEIPFQGLKYDFSQWNVCNRTFFTCRFGKIIIESRESGKLLSEQCNTM